MSVIYLGTYGVKRQSIRKGNPRNFIANLLQKSPRISDEELREKVKAAVLKNEDYLDAVVEYWVAGERRNLTRPPRPSRPAHQEPEQREEAAAKVAEYRAQVEQIAKPRIVQFVLLEMVMPNGKTLAECSFKEVAGFGAKFAALAKGGKPNEKVGTLSETEVRKLFR
jgi:hypothetical protein